MPSMVVGTTLGCWMCCSTVIVEEEVYIIQWVFFVIVLVLVDVLFRWSLVPSVFPLVPPVLTEKGVESKVVSMC